MRIRSIEYDFDAETIVIGYEDGSVQRVPFTLTTEQRPSGIRHYRLDFATGQLALRLPNGSTATAELAIPGASDRLMLAGRLVVYLDQNLWSRLSAARYGHRVVSPTEQAASLILTQLVAERKIILPVSAGHFLETGRYRGPSRLPLASTLLELCGGWQMRHPGVVGARELVAAVNRKPSLSRFDVFTLEPNSTFLRPFPAPAPAFPEPLGSILSNVIALTATYDTVIDPSGLIDEGAEARRRWAAAQDALVELFSKNDLSRDQIHRAALGRLLVDYGAQELQDEKRIDLPAIQSWLPRAADDVAGMPYLGRLWRVMFARLRNGSSWSANDLVDIHNLCAAAGYADVAAGEKRTIADLRVAKPVTLGARLATSLEATVTAIETTIADRRLPSIRSAS